MIGTTINGEFFFNLDSNVGPGQRNAMDDFQLVQLGFYFRARDPGGKSLSEAERAVYNAVKPTSDYTGQPNHPLTIAIATYQRARGGTQDGIVSVLPAHNPVSYGKNHHRIIALLQASIRLATREYWPRIDKHPVCPYNLKTAVWRICGSGG